MESGTTELQAKNMSTERNLLLCAGPCSAETEEQMMETALRLKSLGINLFRAGVWKPRTKPGQFEGVGERGLFWLRKIKRETGMRVATEVATASHVNAALKYDIDVLWIGARTTATPFAVQEIADALRGRNVEVMVKNPLNPDPALWMGALQRIKEAGVKHIYAIHRGFSSYGKNIYRNPPQWQVALEVKQQMPGIPMICDPSHMGGARKHIAPLSQKALDLGYDGLMVEVHHNPEKAWSDKNQQLTPEAFHRILKSLIIRDETTEAESTKFNCLRKEIDRIDDDLLELLAERIGVATQIGEVKKEQSVNILQSGRWQQILGKLEKRGRSLGLSNTFLHETLKSIHQESINHQEKVMQIR